MGIAKVSGEDLKRLFASVAIDPLEDASERDLVEAARVEEGGEQGRTSL